MIVLINKIMIAFLLAIVPLLLFSQKMDLQTVSAAGGSAQNPVGTLDWTLGEWCVRSYFSNQIYWGEGFQQASPQLTTDTDEPGPTMASLLVYPNPTANFITVETKHDIIVQIYDATGRPVTAVTKVITNAQIDLSHLPAGLYFLHSYDKDGRPLRTTKVQRVN